MTARLETKAFAQSSAVSILALSADEKTVVIGLESGALKVLDSGTDETLLEDIEAHPRAVHSVEFSGDTKEFVTGTAEETTVKPHLLHIVRRPISYAISEVMQ